MHTIQHGKFSMHFNSDLSGTVSFGLVGDAVMEIPGELLRMYIRKYVLNHLRDEFSNFLYRQVTELGGIHHQDAAQILEKIDNLKAISTGPNPSDVLHGTTYLFGCPVHITFLRVERRKDGFWDVIDPDYADELRYVEECAGDASDGPLQVVSVPGFAGKYVAYTFPHSE